MLKMALDKKRNSRLGAGYHFSHEAALKNAKLHRSYPLVLTVLTRDLGKKRNSRLID